ncbi:Alpha-1,6-mannosyl-glycoprotein 2-beta-N-acetylglucosaminyltransferase [Hypsibius exemplaris]|uniref:Alpha-1,6-mannosyl-glycoprotein 2-beta-N-acetylglucosaminyltransferase n=1 Tax=Hypsibius exemplaris TaxID=2072580 RepID=A0A1W0WAV3_HYPEX|nr:Alpha-1,6-mannosyl-glycoprotein 2-beta-N-acetylglucosaminyltransferase [Hypsibius exemplaris]
MARYKFQHLWGAGLLTFLCFQATLVIHYAARLEDELISPVLAVITAESLLSRANVSAEIRSYREEVKRLNREQFIRNEDVLGNFTAGNESAAAVIVIQVHDRILYLEALIGSLGKVRGIEQALVVFSHDVYSKEMNALIRGVRFVRTLQIYYPYSSQLYPKGYPGADPNGTILPPGYGRTVDLTQIKLHWLWKLVQVFRELRALRNHTGPKMFLEEDHYVSPDLLDVLAKTKAMQAKSCPSCILILGGYPKQKLWHDLNWDVVRLTRFYASGNNMGMVLERNFWQRFMECGKEYCTIDDYNWDWTLQHMHLKCFPEQLRILKPDAPRVWHVGNCGTHTKQKWKCRRARITESIRNLDTQLANNQANLFLESLRMVSTLKSPLPVTPNTFGGWGDPRDHNMCLAILRDG